MKNKKRYKLVHVWLGKNFGKANRCEGNDCSRISCYYDWAKLKYKRYLKKRENFVMLCRSCHHKYDMTKSWYMKLKKKAKLPRGRVK